jgi:hypothetical protein
MGTEIARLEGYSSLLEFMQALAARFKSNHEAARAGLALCSEQGRAAYYRYLKANAQLVLQVPFLLTETGLYLLTPGERQELFRCCGYAREKLATEEDDGSFDPAASAVLTILTYNRDDTDGRPLFERIAARLETEQGPARLRRRHIDALDEILSEPGISGRFPARQAELLISWGVTLQPDRMYLMPDQVRAAMEHLCGLIALGLLGQGAATPGELLYGMYVRAPLK